MIKKWLWPTLFLTIIFFSNWYPVKDSDFGWHYRCGNELLHGAPCLSNTYSYFLADYHAYYPGFIFDMVTALVYNVSGFIGLSLLYAAAMTITAYFFFKATVANRFISFLTYLGIVYLSASVLNIGWRPQVLTFALVVYVYTLLQNIDKNHLQKLYVFPPLFLLWVNTHIGFFTGLVLLGIACIDRLARLLIKRDRTSLRIFLWFTGIALLSAIATLINPFGYKVYIELYRHMISPLNTMIAEWVAPPLFYIIIMSILLGSIVLGTIIKKRGTIFEILTLIFFFITACMARRNLPLFYGVAGIQLLTLLPHITYQIKEDTKDILMYLLGAGLIAVMAIQIKTTLSFALNWDTYCHQGQANYPCQALREYPQLHGNVYSMYEYGGFLLWQRPDIKVFSDGRMPAWTDEHGESVYMVYLKILQTQPGWNEKLRKEKTDYILIARGVFLDLLLQEKAKDYGWKQVYKNKNHVIYQNMRGD